MNNVVKIGKPKLQNINSKILGILKWTFFALVLLLLYVPILYIIVQSFNNSTTGEDFGGLTLKWYQKMFENDGLMQAIYTTISMAIIATIASVILGTLAAIGINALDTKKRKKMILLNNIPVLNADIVTGVFLMLMFRLLNLFLPNVFGYFSMLFSHIFFCIPYVILSVLPKLNEIDNNLFDAALDLGCKPVGALWKIIIPSIKSGIVSGALIAFTMSIDDFVISYMTGGNGVENFSMWLFSIKNPLRNNAFQMASAYNTIISVGTLLILVIYNVVIKRKKKGINR